MRQITLVFSFVLLYSVSAAAQADRLYQRSDLVADAALTFLEPTGLEPIDGSKILLPTPAGDELAVRLEAASVLPASLQARYPDIKQFRGTATDGTTIFIQVTPSRQ